MARRVVTAREQYELAEPFVFLAAGEPLSPQPELDLDPAPTPVAPAPKVPKAPKPTLQDLIKGYQHSVENEGPEQADAAISSINKWISYRPKFKQQYLHPGGIPALKEMLGDLDYGDLVGVLNDKHHKALTDNHQYDPHTGQKVPGGDTDEDVDAVADLLQPQAPGQITPEILEKQYPGLTGPLQHWMAITPEEQKQKLDKHLKWITNPKGGAFAPEHAKKWKAIHQDAFGEPWAGDQPPSFAEQVQKAFGPAGFTVKTEDQFFNDHVLPGSGSPSGTDSGTFADDIASLPYTFGQSWHVDEPTDSHKHGLATLIGLSDDNPEKKKALQGIYDKWFGQAADEQPEHPLDVALADLDPETNSYYKEWKSQLGEDMQQWFAKNPQAAMTDYYKYVDDADGVEDSEEYFTPSVGDYEPDSAAAGAANTSPASSGYDPAAFAAAYQKVFPGSTYTAGEHFATPEKAQQILRNIIDEPEEEGVGYWDPEEVENWSPDDDDPPQYESEEEYLQALSAWQDDKEKAHKLLDTWFGEGASGGQTGPAKTAQDYKPKNDAEWEQFFKVLADTLGYDDGAVSPALQKAWKDVSDTNWELNLNGLGDFAKNWKDYHDQNLSGSDSSGAAPQFNAASAAAEYGKIIGIGPDVHSGGKAYKDMSQEEFQTALNNAWVKWSSIDPEKAAPIQALYTKLFGDSVPAQGFSPGSAGPATGLMPPAFQAVPPSLLHSDGSLSQGALNFIWNEYGKYIADKDNPGQWIKAIFGQGGPESFNNWKPDDWKVVADEWNNLSEETKDKLQQQALPAALAQAALSHAQSPAASGVQPEAPAAANTPQADYAYFSQQLKSADPGYWYNSKLEDQKDWTPQQWANKLESLIKAGESALEEHQSELEQWEAEKENWEWEKENDPDSWRGYDSYDEVEEPPNASYTEHEVNTYKQLYQKYFGELPFDKIADIADTLNAVHPTVYYDASDYDTLDDWKDHLEALIEEAGENDEPELQEEYQDLYDKHFSAPATSQAPSQPATAASLGPYQPSSMVNNLGGNTPGWMSDGPVPGKSVFKMKPGLDAWLQHQGITPEQVSSWSNSGPQAVHDGWSHPEAMGLAKTWKALGETGQNAWAKYEKGQGVNPATPRPTIDEMTAMGMDPELAQVMTHYSDGQFWDKFNYFAKLDKNGQLEPDSAWGQVVQWYKDKHDGGGGGPVPFTGGVDFAKEYMQATDWTGPSPEMINSGGLKFSEMTAEQAKKVLAEGIKMWQSMGSTKADKVQALYDKYFGAGPTPVAPGKPAPFDAATVAKEVGYQFSIDPEKIHSGGLKWKEMSFQQAKKALEESISIYKSSKPGLQKIYDKYFAGSADDEGDDHQKLVTSPQFKAWFKKNNHFDLDTDNGGADLKKMLLDPANPWTQQKVKGFQNSSDFKSFQESKNFFQPSINQLLDLGIEHSNAEDLAGLNPEKFKEYYDFVKSHPENYPPDSLWGKIVNLIDGKGAAPTPSSAPVPEGKPELPLSPAAPWTVKTNGKLSPEFTDWVWDNADKNLTPAQVAQAVRSWTPEHWQAAAAAFQQHQNPGMPAAGSLPTAQQVIDHLVGQEGPWQWDGPDSGNSSSGLVTLHKLDPQAVKDKLESWANKPGSSGQAAKKTLEELYKPAPVSGGDYAPDYDGPPVEWLNEHHPGSQFWNDDISASEDWTPENIQKWWNGYGQDSAAGVNWTKDSKGDKASFQKYLQPAAPVQPHQGDGKAITELADLMDGMESPDGDMTWTTKGAGDWMMWAHSLSPELIASYLKNPQQASEDFQDYVNNDSDKYFLFSKFLNDDHGLDINELANDPENFAKLYHLWNGDTTSPAVGGAPAPAFPQAQPWNFDDFAQSMKKADPNYWDQYMLNSLSTPEAAKLKLKQFIKDGEQNIAAGGTSFKPEEIQIYKDLLEKYFGGPPTKLGPAPFDEKDIIAQVKKADPSHWDSHEISQQNNDPEAWKLKLESMIKDGEYSLDHYGEGSWTHQEIKIYKDLLKKYFSEIPVTDSPAASSGSPAAPPPGMQGGPRFTPPPTLEEKVRDQLKTMTDLVRAPHTIFTDDDLATARSPQFQQWFADAPDKYRQVASQFPAVALDDFAAGGDYGWVPESEDEAQVYKLLHYPEAQESGGKIKHPSGETLQLPGDWEKSHSHWPGHTKNPESKSQARPSVEFKPKGPDVPNQLEIPLPGGSSWEEQKTLPTLRRGIEVDFNRYNSDSQKKLLSLPGEAGARHRAAKSLLDEIRDLMLGTRGLDRDDPRRQPTLFDTDDTALPDDIPKVNRYSQTDDWLKLFAWGQKNQLTPEQMWLVAKQSGSKSPDSFGVPPLSFLIEQSKRNPRDMARQVSQLIGNDQWPGDDLEEVARKLRRIKDNSDYGNSYDPQVQQRAAKLYDQWFGEGLFNKLLADRILDYLEMGAWKPSEFKTHPDFGGIGPHWTTKDHTDFGTGGSATENSFPVEVVADWPGLGEDPDRKDSAWNYPSEKEITKNPGTPVIVKKLRIKHPANHDRNEWLDLDIEPHIRYARLDVDIAPRRSGRTVLSHRERYAADWDDWGPHPMDSPLTPVYGTPSSYDTPRWRKDERPRLPGGELYFSPNEVNPPSTALSRPDIYWQEKQPEQDTMVAGEHPIFHDTPLFRGMAVNLNDPRAAELHRMVFGHHPGDDTLFDTPAHDTPRWDHPELGRALLEHLEGGHHNPNRGLGAHWTVDPTQAHEFAMSSFHDFRNPPGAMMLPVRIRAGWSGTGENPYRHDTDEDYDGQWADEQEMNLLPGAKLNVQDVQIRHPHTKRWVSVGPGSPEVRHAAVHSAPRPRNAKRILTQRELLEG